MAQYAAQLIAKVAVEGSDEAKRQLKSTSEEVHKTSESFGVLKNALSFAGGMLINNVIGSGFGFLKDQFGQALQQSKDAQAGMAQTVQVLKSTHDVSGMTAQAVGDLATKFSHLTMFQDDTVQSAENMLLTFTNIGKKGGVFDTATQTVLDMSQALGQDTKSSAIQLGKALNDPLTGFSALQRVGVTFDEQQKKSIKTFMEHNNIIAAQKVILTELGKEFGGSALAAGKTFDGQMAILNQRLDDIRQNIADALLPIITQFVSYVSVYAMPRLNDFSDWFQKQAIPKIQEFGQWFETDGIKAITQFGQELYNVALIGVHFVQWLHDGTPGAQALTYAAVGLGIAIAAVHISNIVTDMSNFIRSVPEMIAKMFLVQQSAEGIAGAEGLGAITSEAGNAEKAMGAMGVAADGLKLSFAGMLGLVGGVAGLEILLAKWLHDSGVIPDVKKITGGKDNQPDWITHNNPADALKEAAKQAKAVNDQINQAWKDMTGLYDWAQAHHHILGDLQDPLTLQPTDIKIQEIKTHIDDLSKPLILPDMKPFNSAIEASRQKVIDLKAHLDDLKGPIAINVGTRTVTNAIANVMYLKSQIDDAGGVSGHASGIANNPVGHWATVGERGPELMYVPQGASILPNGMSPSGGGGGSQPVYLQIDGNTFARLMMPHVANQIRNNVPIYGA